MSNFFSKLIACLFGVVAIVMMIVGLSETNLDLVSLSTFIIWAGAVLYALSRQEKNLMNIFLLVTIFIFLMSRIFVRWTQNGEIYKPFSYDTMAHIYICIFLSICGLWIGTSTRIHFSVHRRVSGKQKINLSPYGSNINLELLRTIVGFLTIMSGICVLLINIEKIAEFNALGGGGELRVSYVSTMPEIVLRISYIYNFVFAIYLATFPEKKKVMPYILMYIGISASKMMYGSRCDFVLALMFVYVYFYIRDNLNFENTENKWLGKKEKIFTIISIPALVVLLVFVSAFREDATFEFTSLTETFIEFFEAQGTSFDVIGYAYENADKLTQSHKLYLFDNTYTFLTTNPISRFFTGMKSYNVNTLERALYGTSLDQSLYYIINPSSYLSGKGCGSSYIAEVFLGYGYIGVFIFNILLGSVLLRLTRYTFNVLWKNTIVLLFTLSIFFIPRSGFDEFVGDFLSVTHIFTVLIIYIVYKLLCIRRISFQ